MDTLNAAEKAELLRVAESVGQAAFQQLSAQRHPSQCILFVANLQRAIDDVVLGSEYHGRKSDCSAGCNHCCYVRVEALQPEVFHIARELKAMPPEQLRAHTERLRAHAEMMESHARTNNRIRCPFLVDEVCSIYPVRPAVCRKAHSLDVAKCRTPDADIPQNIEIIMKSEALLKGTAAAYRKAGLVATATDFGLSVLDALTDDQAEVRWYNDRPASNAIV